MLAVTEAAAEAISALTAQGGNQQEGGLRFAMAVGSDSQATLALTVAPAPADGDEVVMADEGATVYLEPRAADYLADKILDVQPDPDGQLSFAVLEQT